MKSIRTSLIGAVLSLTVIFHSFQAMAWVDGSANVAEAVRIMSEALMQLNDVPSVVISSAEAIDTRAAVLATTFDLRSLNLRENRVSRELADTEDRIKIIDAMSSQTGNTYSISKEFIFEHAPVLLSGCFIMRPFLSNAAKDEAVPSGKVFDARAMSAMCTLLDVSTVFAGAMVALAPGNKRARAAFEQAFTSREKAVPTGRHSYIGEPITYPKTVRALRIGGVSLAALFVVQQSLSWAYSDEINYRESISRLTPTGVGLEIKHQLKEANALTLELAATRIARYKLLSEQR